MQFQYQINKHSYINNIRANNKNSLIKKLIVNSLKEPLKWNFETIMYNNSYMQNPQIESLKVSINDDGITIVSDISEIYIGWTAIKSIKLEPNFLLLIKFGLNKKITIPLTSSDFKNEDEKLQLINALEHKMIGKNKYLMPMFLPEDTLLKLKFIYSIEDEEYFYIYNTENSLRGKKIHKFLQFISPAIFSICYIWSYIIGSILYTALSLLGLVCSLYISKTKHRHSKMDLKGISKICKKTLSDNKAYYDPKSEKTVILSDKGIFLENSDVIIFIEWKKISNFDIIETNNYIGIWNKNSVIFWIPNSAFSSLEDKDKFILKILPKNKTMVVIN